MYLICLEWRSNRLALWCLLPIILTVMTQQSPTPVPATISHIYICTTRQTAALDKSTVCLSHIHTLYYRENVIGIADVEFLDYTRISVVRFPEQKKKIFLHNICVSPVSVSVFCSIASKTIETISTKFAN